jgi:hypothetical protein
MAKQEVDALQQVARPKSSGLNFERCPARRSEAKLKALKQGPKLIRTVERPAAIIIKPTLKIIVDSGLGET